ncbi:TlpA family protein disulfide reductase [Roseimaritima sediminicola]|uniref:TlpA family protein disulfide reductase n=1 Tax=Roseimaritima sediminicola TaxID=2662066 RepID=UPI00129823F0|nr:TlpA disulfide reductase family protein [Roseimaritima sediminicola]
MPLDLQPGQTHTVDFGTGVVVRGRVKPSGKVASSLDMNYCLNFFLKRASGIDPPEPIRRAGFDWRHGWSFNLRNSEEGRRFLSTLPYHFVKFQSDGSFEIHGVEPGDYQFAISIYEPPEGCLIDPVGLDVVDVSVGNQDLDLGEIEVEVKLGPQVGERFPNFRFAKMSRDESGSIADFTGRYLLIDFWATWCAPCIKQLPDVRTAANRWDSEKVAVLSVSLDEDSDHARKFILEKQVDWPQALLAGRDTPVVRQQLGISSVPIHYVLDPEGTILLRTFKLDEAVTFIDKKLDSSDSE